MKGKISQKVNFLRKFYPFKCLVQSSLATIMNRLIMSIKICLKHFSSFKNNTLDKSAVEQVLPAELHTGSW